MFFMVRLVKNGGREIRWELRINLIVCRAYPKASFMSRSEQFRWMKPWNIMVDFLQRMQIRI